MTAAQTWDPERYARNARYVADLAAPAVELLGPRPGERILDLDPARCWMADYVVPRFSAVKP